MSSSVLAKAEGSSLAGRILGTLSEARWKRARAEDKGEAPMSAIEIYRENLALIDQELSGIRGTVQPYHEWLKGEVDYVSTKSEFRVAGLYETLKINKHKGE